MMIPVLFRCLALGLLLFGAVGHGAVLDVPVAAERLPLGATIEYFLDKGGRTTPEAAMRDGRYRPANGDSLVLGYRAAVLWVRLSLRNPADAAIERWLHIEPERLERVSLFVPQSGGGYSRLDNGLQVAVAERSVPARGIAFPLHLPAGASQSVYLRVETRTFLFLSPVLWTPAAFDRALQREDFFAMLGIGALLGMTLSSVMLFPLRRDQAALSMGCCMACFCLFHLAHNGYGETYLWPDHPSWDLRASPVFVVLSQVWLNRFMGEFIPLRAYGWRWAGRGLDGILLLEMALLMAFLLGEDFSTLIPIMPPLLLGGLLFYLGISLAAQRQGYRPARHMATGLLLALGIVTFRVSSVLVPIMLPLLLVGLFFNLGITLATQRQAYRPAHPMAMGLLLALGIVILRVSKAGDWLPLPQDDQISWVAVAFIVHLPFQAAISQRVDLLRQEKDAALAQALAAQQGAASRLEAQVAERTRQLREAKERAECADQAKGEFLARVSHELRTPLHTILGYAHLLRRDAGDLSGERLALLEEGGLHLAKLVDDLLDYARGKRGGLVLNPEAAFLYRLLERLKEHGAALADKRRHRFDVCFADDLPAVVRVDARRVEQVALILLSNAVRYTDKGRITLTVQAFMAELGRVRLRIAVEDSGPGIATSDLGRIFDPFERAPDGENTGGLGLGLAIGRQIVRAMGGELRVDSRLGEGSRFWFEVSLDLACEMDIPLSFPDLDILGYMGPPRSILLVEDHAANRRLLEQLLAELGFAVCAAGGVGEALALTVDASFDLALLDQRLPDGTAWDILRVLRGNGLTASIPAVLLSAQPPRSPHDWGDLPGFDAVLLKPGSGAEVLECVGGLLGLAWLRAEESATLDGLDGASVALPQGVPSADKCVELAELARQGAIYEIEEWIRRIRQTHPECEGYCREVEEHLASLDFGGIVATLPA